MKKILFTLFVAIIVVSPTLFAGTYTLDNRVVHLQGDTSEGKTFWLESQVKIVLNHLKVGWDYQGNVDRIRYHISCKDGKAVLQNVEYLDAAEGTMSVKWKQSDRDLNRDFSYVKDNRDKIRDNTVKYSTKFNLQHSDIKSAEVRFHIDASGRHYIIIWTPKTNKVEVTWNKIRH